MKVHTRRNNICFVSKTVIVFGNLGVITKQSMFHTNFTFPNAPQLFPLALPFVCFFGFIIIIIAPWWWTVQRRPWSKSYITVPMREEPFTTINLIKAPPPFASFLSPSAFLHVQSPSIQWGRGGGGMRTCIHTYKHGGGIRVACSFQKWNIGFFLVVSSTSTCTLLSLVHTQYMCVCVSIRIVWVPSNCPWGLLSLFESIQREWSWNRAQ